MHRRKHRRIRILWQVMKTTGVVKAVIVYLICFVIIAALIEWNDPTINSFTDAVWYCYVSSSSTGFGDIVAVDFLSRALTVVLYILTVCILAVITAFVTNFYIEVAKSRLNNSVSEFTDKMERLTDLSEEELQEISEFVRKNKA